MWVEAYRSTSCDVKFCLVLMCLSRVFYEMRSTLLIYCSTRHKISIRLLLMHLIDWISLSDSLTLWLSVCLSLWLCLSVCLTLCLAVCLSRSLSLSLALSLSLSHSRSLHACSTGEWPMCDIPHTRKHARSADPCCAVPRVLRPDAGGCCRGVRAGRSCGTLPVPAGRTQGPLPFAVETASSPLPSCSFLLPLLPTNLVKPAWTCPARLSSFFPHSPSSACLFPAWPSFKSIVFTRSLFEGSCASNADLLPVSLTLSCAHDPLTQWTCSLWNLNVLFTGVV